jgi:uncharacterized protein YraI
MKILRVWGLLVAGFLILPSAASAQEAVTAKTVHVRAGPAEDYPVVAILPPGFRLLVQGCLSDYSWCDVLLPDNNRGWVHAGNLTYFYQGAHVPILGYGSAIGIGIVMFSIGNYWDNHYRVYPWYRDRPRWIDRPVHPRPPAGHRVAPVRPAPVLVPDHPRAPPHARDGSPPGTDRDGRRSPRDGDGRHSSRDGDGRRHPSGSKP